MRPVFLGSPGTLRWAAGLGTALLLGTTATSANTTPPGAESLQASDTKSESPGQTPPQPTTSFFRYRQPSNPVLYDLLSLPEFLVKLALTPTFPLVAWADNHALDHRLYDWVTNEEKTSLWLPTANVLSNDAAAFGLRYTHSDLFDGEERFFLSGRMGLNSDRKLETNLEVPVIPLDGQPLTLRASHELNHNERYYGVGDGNPVPSALKFNETRAEVEVQFLGSESSLSPFHMTTRFSYLHRKESPGTDPTMRSVETNAPIAGFGAFHDYLELAQSFTHDLRDANGRTHGGTMLQLDLTATRSMDRADLSAAGATARAAVFFKLAPRHRVLVVQAGASAVTPWNATDGVPNHALVILGSESYPRGYAKRRFRDRVGWWGSLEYRYPIVDLSLAGSGASATLFVDTGQVASGLSPLQEAKLRYSYGLGLRAETLVALAMRLQVGFSPEGMQLTLSLNEAYDRP